MDTKTFNAAIGENPAGYLSASDERFLRTLDRIADAISANRKTRPIVLLSGPSGSGKTTTAHLLKQILDKKGHPAHTLSMDNYFIALSEAERALVLEGKLDLESPNRLNRTLLNAQLQDMADGKPVILPHYDFVRSTPVSSGVTLTRQPGEIIILEGIHALNPQVITIPDEETAKVYVSVRTRVRCGSTILHPSKIRLMRRIIRDNLFRDRKPLDTVLLYDSVERGEETYIMPHKHRADYDVDSFLDYELSVMKTLLPKIPVEDKETLSKEETVLHDLHEILSHLTPIDQRLVPRTSLLREFIGAPHK